MADAKPADDVKDVVDPVLEALQDDEGEQDAAKDSSPDKKEPEVAKDTAEKADKAESKVPPEDKKDPVKPEAKAEEEAESDKSEDKPLGKAEERKAELKSEIDELETKKLSDNTEIRDLVSKRNALKAEVERANAEVYQPATEDELVGDGMTALEAKVEAMRQQNEMEKYNSQVADAQLTLSSESERVIKDFPIFNPDSEQYDKELAEEAAVHLRAGLILDDNTQQVIGTNLQVYPFYQTLARAHQSSVTRGQIQGRQDTEKMLANADSPSNTAPERKAEDPVLKILSSDDY